MRIGTISLTENSPGAAALWSVGPDSTSVFSQAKAIFTAKEAAPSNPSSDAVPTPAAYVAAAVSVPVSESIPSQKSPVATTSPLRRRQSTEATPDVFFTPPPHQKQEPAIVVVEATIPVVPTSVPPQVVSTEAEAPPQRGSVKDMALKYDKTAAASSAVSKLDGSRRVSTGDAPIRPDLPITEAETPPPPLVAPIVNKRRSSLSGLTQTTSCAVCGKPLYPMDSQMKLDKVSVHSSCARCHECKCTVSFSNYAKSERNGAFVLLCQTHYMRQTYETKGSYSSPPNNKQTK